VDVARGVYLLTSHDEPTHNLLSFSELVLTTTNSEIQPTPDQTNIEFCEFNFLKSILLNSLKKCR